MEKKDWNKPEVSKLEIKETMNGGKPSMNFDQQWFDQNGALHVNFVDDTATPTLTPIPNNTSGN